MFAAQPIAYHPFPAQAQTNATYSHLKWDHDESSVSAHHQGDGSFSNVQLPRMLIRPDFVEIPRSHLAAVAPELADIPAEYIRKGLRAQASQMIAGLSGLNLPSSLPQSKLASTPSLALHSRPSSASVPPTPILALPPSSKAQSSSFSVAIVATHVAVLASSCARMPRMPQSQASLSGQLPVVPLSVPSPAAFAALHAYLYTGSVASLLRSMLPSLPPAFLASLSPKQIQATFQSPAALHQLAQIVQSQSNGAADIMGLAQRVGGLWKNATALGVYDPALWDTIDLAWEVILGALNLSAGVY